MIVKKLPSTTNCDVYRIELAKYNLIIKYFGKGLINRKIFKRLKTEYLNIKKETSNFVSVPKTYFIFRLCKNFIIFEEYKGCSIKDIFIRNSGILDSDIRVKCREFIKLLPESIPLDTNPGNIVLSKLNEFSIVDFIPPNPFVSENDPEYDQICRIFPTLDSKYYYDGKKEAYTINANREYRFFYHIDHILTKMVRLKHEERPNNSKN